MIKELIKIANELDARGLIREAGFLDKIVNRLTGKEPEGEEGEEVVADVTIESFDELMEKITNDDCNKTCASDAVLRYRTYRLEAINNEEWYGNNPEDEEPMIEGVLLSKEQEEA